MSEAYCKYIRPVGYDDRLIIETRLDLEIKAGMKFDYRILDENGQAPIATGFTRHPCVDKDGRVVRPPKFVRDLIRGRRQSKT